MRPIGLAVDAGGTVYVADGPGEVIVKFTPAPPGPGQPTWNGSLLAGVPNVDGWTDSPAGASAKFWFPAGLALDPVSGYLFVADLHNDAVRAIAPTAGAPVTTVVGTKGWWGSVAGLLQASLTAPMGVAVNPLTRSLVITVPDAVFQTE
jgi:DNA-binding beta-propeller fold protein YncE